MTISASRNPGNRETDETDKREHVVQERVAVDRGVDADRQTRVPT